MSIISQGSTHDRRHKVGRVGIETVIVDWAWFAVEVTDIAEVSQKELVIAIVTVGGSAETKQVLSCSFSSERIFLLWVTCLVTVPSTTMASLTTTVLVEEKIQHTPQNIFKQTACILLQNILISKD